MVQRKVANKIGIKSHLHKLDTQLVNPKPSSPSSSSSCSSSTTHEKLKKIMKKSRSIKRSDDSRTSPPLRNKKTPPNYMKSTTSFEARKEQSPSPKTPIPKASNESSSGIKGSRTTSLKTVRTLTKTPSFKPIRSSKKMKLCEDVNSQRATCSSTLKDSNFPDYLQLNDELDGTSVMKVCPYSYCSLNGHRHAPVPPLKCFLSARRRALKTQKGFKVGCLSPRQIKPSVKVSAIKEQPPVIATPQELDMEDKDFFLEIHDRIQPPAEIQGKDVCIKPKSDVTESTIIESAIIAQEEVDMEEKDLFDNIFGDDMGQTLAEMQGKDACITPDLVEPCVYESLVHQGYGDDRENKGGLDLECSDIDWEEGYCSNSDQMEKTSVENERQELYDEESVSSGAWSDEDGDYASDSSCPQTKINRIEVSSTAFEPDTISKEDDLQGLNHPIEDQSTNYQQEPKTAPNFAEKSHDESNKNHTTIIYNIINFNISVFINGEKTVTVQVPATSVPTDKTNEDDEVSEMNQIIEDEQPPIEVEDTATIEQLNEIEKYDNPEQECNHSSFNDVVTEINEKPTTISDLDELISESDVIVRDRKKPDQETECEQHEFNPRGPNFLPETPDPDAETVDLRHQTIDGRKNAEEWMVDFALQQAVTTLAPARKKKVALLVEAFEKVMPDPVPGPVRIPRYETNNGYASKAFTNARPMQACS